MYWCYWINCLYLCACSPLHHQTTRSRDRSMSCREGGRCKTRPGRTIPNQGKRMKEQGPDAKLQPLKQPLTGICAWFISPELRWGRTIMVIMMNRAIWMPPSSCVIWELCAAHRLTSSQNEPPHTQLRFWMSKVQGEACLMERDGLWLALSSRSGDGSYRFDYNGLQTARLTGRHFF